MLARLVVLCGLFLVVGLSPAFAQQEARSSTKGASTPLPITGTSVDADHNALDVYIRGGASGSGGGTEFNEDTSHSSGAAGTLMLGVRNDAGGTTFTDNNGDYSPIAVDNLGRVIISVLSLSPGTSAANLGKAEDAGHSSGDVGVMSLCVRAASATDRSAGATDGDYEPCAVDANGKLWTNADTEMPAAAALVDDTANPTVPGVASFNMCFDGSTWDRCTKATAGNGAVDTATQRVTIASDSTGQVAVASLPNEGQQTMANSISVALASDQTVPDPCTFRAKSYAPINISTATTTQLVAASASNKLYVCSLHMITNAANNVALVEDDTISCSSPTAGIVGGTTSGTGYIFAANGGLTLGSGHATVGNTAATNRYVCIITSAATQLTGGLTYVLAP